jgi:universal stress protein E
MNRICNILVIVDPTATEHAAVEKGAALAEKCSARLELFVCDTKAARNMRQAEFPRRATGTPLVTDLKAVLEHLAEPLRARGLDVATEAACGDPLHTMLLDRVKHTRAELVIKDTHHHTLAQRTFLTHTDWELIRGCPTSLLLVKPQPWSSVVRVCAAVDPGHQDDKPQVLDRCILDKASVVAKRVGGELHVTNVYIPTAFAAGAASMSPMAFDVSADSLEMERRSKFRALHALVSDHPIPTAHLHVRVGSTREGLCRLAAELHVDIMATGAISRSTLKRAFIGSTAESVLEQLPCDLLIVKPPNFSEA